MGGGHVITQICFGAVCKVNACLSAHVQKVCVCTCAQCRGMCVFAGDRQRRSHASGPHACIHQSPGRG